MLAHYLNIHALPFVLIAFLPALAGAQAPPPAGFPGRAPEGPAAQIVRFAAEPGAIEPGESTTLRWEALNTYSVAISPAVGAVPTRGSHTVAPEATTTYTLTVTGSRGPATASVTVLVAGTEPAAAAQATVLDAQAVPRLWNGDPDLSGVYLGGRDVRLDGAVTLAPGAESYRVPARDDDLGQGAQCLPSGVPGVTMAPFPLQIVHKPDLVVILYEAFNIFRVIPIGREHPEDLDPTWLGHSVAHWEGDTLVVDAVGFNDKTLVSGHRHTEAMHVVERYRRTSVGTISYEAVVTDPTVFASPVRYAGELTLHPEWEIGEYICAENPKDYAELFE